MTPALLSELLGAIVSDELVIFCGAGLSMAVPSSVPSAKSVAADVAQKYSAQTTVALPPDAWTDLETLSRCAFLRGELKQPVLLNLVSWRPFVRDPNAGHYAIADFLATKIIRFAVSANFDVLIEEAAEDLGEDIFTAALDGAEAAMSYSHNPLLKIHGCCKREMLETVWCKEQLTQDPIKKRVGLSKTWLQGQLRGKSIIFVGFWSDWEYLNMLIQDCIDGSQPSLVVLVDPANDADLQAKAPQLWAWANTPGIRFRREQISGADFLDQLRKEFSINYLKLLLNGAATTFTTLSGNPIPTFSFDSGKSTDDFYAMRRDYEGIPNTGICRLKKPSPSSQQLGAMHLRLLAGGAILKEPRFNFTSKAIRLIQGAGRAMSLVQQDFLRETAQITPDDLVICVGAVDNGGAPPNIVRSGAAPTVQRPFNTATKWITADMVTSELGI